MPDTAAAPVGADEGLVRAVAAWSVGATGASSVIEARTTDVEGLTVVRRAAQRQVLGPLLLAAAEGLVVLSEEALDRAARHHLRAQAWCRVLEDRLLEVEDRAETAGGIDLRVLKGTAVAHLDEVDPALRAFSDVDLLVPAAQVDRSVALLCDMGAARPWPQRRPGFDARFGKSVTLTFPDGVEIDLHRTLCDGVHGARIPLPSLFDGPDPFVLGGRTLRALAPVNRLLHAAHHAVLGSPAPRLLSLRDLSGLLTRPDIDVDAVIAAARSWRALPVLLVAVDTTLRTLPTDAPAWRAALDRHVVGSADRGELDRQRAEGSSLGLGKLSVLGELQDRRLRAAYLAALVWPTPAHLRARGQTRRATAATAVRSGISLARNRGRQPGGSLRD